MVAGVELSEGLELTCQGRRPASRGSRRLERGPGTTPARILDASLRYTPCQAIGESDPFSISILHPRNDGAHIPSSAERRPVGTFKILGLIGKHGDDSTEQTPEERKKTETISSCGEARTGCPGLVSNIQPAALHHILQLLQVHW